MSKIRLKINSYKLISLILILSFAFVYWGCSATYTNLTVYKKTLVNYYDSGLYDSDLKKIVDNAIEKIDKIETTENSIVIFDVDETVLSNLPHLKQTDFGWFGYEIWNNWVSKSECKAISQVKRLYDHLTYKNIKIVFLTGRSHELYNATLINLKKEGFTNIEKLILRKPDELNLRPGLFKKLKRQELIDKGYNIIANVGDQASDFEDGYNGIIIKLPNYLYIMD